MENDYQSLENEYNRMIAENRLYDIDGDLFFDLSEYHYINGFYKEAISVLKNALKVFPGDNLFVGQMARCLALGGNVQDGLDYLKENADPNDSESYLAYGELYLLSNKLNYAEKAFEKALQLEEYHFDLICDVADIYYRQYFFEQAIVYIEKILKKKPNDPSYLKKMFLSLAFVKSPEDAMTFLQLDPFDAEVWFNLASDQIAMGKFDEGLDNLKTCLSIDPKCILAWKHKFFVELSLKFSLKDAWNTIQEYENEFPEDEVLCSMKAQYYFSEEDFERAEFYSDKLVQYEVDSVDPYWLMINCCYFLNKKEKFLKFFEKALAFDSLVGYKFFEIYPEAKQDFPELNQFF